METSNRFTKEERLCSKTTIERLYADGKSVAAYPLRAVYIALEPADNEPTVSILLSVPKKRFKHAVDRNLVKRRLREAYRLNKHAFIEEMQQQGKRMAIAILYLDKQHHSFRHLQFKLVKLLKAIAEKEAAE